MRRIISSAWMTVDGVFDAGSMGEWFLPYHSDSRGKTIAEWIGDCDGYLLGRTTYEMLAPHWSALTKNELGIADKLNSVRKYVVSSTLQVADWNNSTIISGDAIEAIRELKSEPGGEILIAGSATLVESLMNAALIDEYRFLVHPVVAGKGKRFFREGMRSGGLQLIRDERLGNDVRYVCYAPASAP